MGLFFRDRVFDQRTCIEPSCAIISPLTQSYNILHFHTVDVAVKKTLLNVSLLYIQCMSYFYFRNYSNGCKASAKVENYFVLCHHFIYFVVVHN